MISLYCGNCQCTLHEMFRIQEVFVCDYCGKYWTLVELLLGIECNNWSKK